jgi:DNA replication and repair protein RecF
VAFSRIELRNFRCFDALTIDISSKSNLFFGKNGCGKTSILESIYVASCGRSFRTSNLESLIKKGSNSFKIKAYDDNTGSILEVKKSKSKAISIKINNSLVTTSELARTFPSFSIDSKTFFYNDNAPDYRRKHLDRGLFIASTDYAKDWFGYFRGLKQRNAALKIGDISQARAYDETLINHGTKLNYLRESLVLEVKKIYFDFVKILEQHNSRAQLFSGIDIHLKSGFNDELGLKESFIKSESADLKRKSTTLGPHKADVIFESKDSLIKDIFSRGEQKMLSILWSLSQNIYLEKFFKLSPILLLDDLSSELDAEMLNCFLPIIKYIDNRFIFSNIVDSFNSKIDLNEQSFKKFHVEQLT